MARRGVAAAADHTCQNSVLRSEFTSAERSLTFYCASSCRLADPALFPCVGWRRRAYCPVRGKLDATNIIPSGVRH